MELTFTSSAARGSIKHYVTLMKPRVMLLAVFTGVAGMVLAPGHLPPLVFMTAVFCLALGGGGAGAINMWLERDLDARMERTRNRPIPSGRIAADRALCFAVLCIVISVSVMAVAVNFLAANLLLLTILFYACVYTIWLKPRTAQNIVIGGAAGALPPVIGWAAVTGNIALNPLLLFLIIFLWTPPHFWALALARASDYRHARIPMLPVVAGYKATTRQMLAYALLLFPVSLMPYVTGLSHWPYAAGAAVLGGVFIAYVLRLWRRMDLRWAMPVFACSIFYLTGIFSLLILDRIFYAQ